MVIDRHHDGCSKAVAHGAAPASATDDVISDIARGMALQPVNPLQVASGMGRGADLDMICESCNHRLEDTRADEQLQHGTPDGQGNKGHRGNGHRGT